MSSNDLICTAEFSESDALSALETARAAIARWTGGVRPSAELPQDISRISPQARWVDQAQRNLAQWIAHGGFAQAEGAGEPLPAMMRPVMYSPSAHCPAQRAAKAFAN
ncbi:hypothetical protein KY495_14420 [Massilia sp. PAMC28688]|uniref:hypothetical protein n=1 Tax=Massilia sp. PAMC28688 TaxID=2861283 RepID=UPI001C635BDC|nr:hypothetical protein [Massilia sp. PAMC28688]QYF91971.1 hypothetical protein KY495_14420 [Massilia sp. PAMC28688]